MNWLIATFGTNWKTTLGGILFAVPGIVTASALASGVHLNPVTIMALGIVSSLGGLLIGVTAKDYSTHSSQDQVTAKQATVDASTIPAQAKAAEQVKAADAQVAAAGKEKPK